MARREIVVDMALLEYCVREHLNKTAPRVMAVLDPVKVVIDNYPEGETEYMEIENNPEDVNAGVRKVAFARELFIERDDFMEDAPKKFFRLTPGQEVRLKGAYIIKCTGVDKDAGGNITLIHCTYDPESRSGSGTEASNRKEKGYFAFGGSSILLLFQPGTVAIDRDIMRNTALDVETRVRMGEAIGQAMTANEMNPNEMNPNEMNSIK